MVKWNQSEWLHQWVKSTSVKNRSSKWVSGECGTTMLLHWWKWCCGKVHNASRTMQAIIVPGLDWPFFFVWTQHLRAACYSVWVRALISDIMVYTALAQNNSSPWKWFPVSLFPCQSSSWCHLHWTLSHSMELSTPSSHSALRLYPAKFRHEGQWLWPESQSHCPAGGT